MEREKERMGKRGMKNTFAFYDRYTYPDIDTTNLQPDQEDTGFKDRCFSAPMPIRSVDLHGLP